MKDERKEKFTPGPWKYVRVKEDIDTFAIRTETDDTLAAVGISPVGWRPGKDIANAALIAAAPEMYDELKDLLDAMEAGLFPQAAPGVDYPAVMEKKWELRKLLKKARGEE